MYLVEVFNKEVNVCKYYKTRSKKVDFMLKDLPFGFFSELKAILASHNVNWQSALRCEKVLATVNFGKDSGDLAFDNANLHLSEILGLSIKVRRKIDGRYKMYKDLDWYTVFRLFE